MVVCGKFSGQLGDRIFCLQNPDVGFQDILFISVKQFRFLFGRKRKCLRYLINIRQFDLGDFIRVQLENRKEIFSISFIFAECLQAPSSKVRRFWRPRNPGKQAFHILA